MCRRATLILLFVMLPSLASAQFLSPDSRARPRNLGNPILKTLTVGVPSGFTGQIILHNSSNANTTTLQASTTAANGVITFPAVTDTVAVLGTADQVVSGGANVTAQSLSTGNITIDCGSRPLQFITNGGAFTITAPVSDGSCLLLIANNASAGAVSFSGFSVGGSTGDALTTTNTNKFTVNIWRINGTSGYRIAAHQ